MIKTIQQVIATGEKISIEYFFKKGGFILAIRSKLPIVPLTIIGASSILPSKSFKLAKGKVKLIIDKPIITHEMKEKNKNDLVDHCRKIIIDNKNEHEDKFC